MRIDNGKRNVNAGTTFKQFLLILTLYGLVGLKCLAGLLGYF